MPSSLFQQTRRSMTAAFFAPYSSGSSTANYTPTLRLSMVPGRDFAIIKPPRSKADQAAPILEPCPYIRPSTRPTLPTPPYGSSASKPASHVAEPCACPSPFSSKKAFPFRPMSHTTVDIYLKLLLRRIMPEADA
jgi:hypothetical protein